MVPVTKKKKLKMYCKRLKEGSVSPVKLLENSKEYTDKRNSEVIEGNWDSFNDSEMKNTKFSFYKLWMYTGPGWLMSIAYLDPGNSKFRFINISNQN